MILRRVLQLGAPTYLRCQSTRSSSILSALHSSPILLSSNKDIYTNLALEHWLYSNLKFDQNIDQEKNSFNQPIVLIWTDEPCLVIGRHQNPWVETTVGLAQKLGIKLARRHSGGGCVYHDENNINISIIGERKLFENRQENLKLLAKILSKKYGIKCEPNKRHDLVHSDSGLKMTGSAAKLGRFNSYHHFTLLVDTDKEIMQAAIRQKQQEFIQTNSSLSTRSSVINLTEMKPDLSVDQVVSDLAQEYGLHYGKTITKSRKAKVEVENSEVTDMAKIRNELTSWDWIYGMTPKFRLEKHINLVHGGVEARATLQVHVDKGVFRSFEIDSEHDVIKAHARKFDHLVGTKFDYKEAMVNVVKTIDASAMIGYEQLFATHLLQMIQEANF